jgi:pimeloyl-ACP methyl ester carboxylesterase
MPHDVAQTPPLTRALSRPSGFGGNADHWRKNTAALAATGNRVWAIDLLGYGYSSKPAPDPEQPAALYCFETWGAQLRDFAADVAGGPAFIASNSVGGIAALQAAADDAAAFPSDAVADASARRLVRGVVLLDVSLRELHASKQPPPLRPLVSAFQRALRTTPLGLAFFGQVAKPDTVRAVLREAYGDRDAVTPELVDVILSPGLQPGAAAVFLDFISYSHGPLAEELLPRVRCPVLVAWGAADPWERVSEARRLYANAPNVEAFIELPGVGHCPQDEAPERLNPLIADFVARHAAAADAAA